MTTESKVSEPDKDPWAILGIPVHADDQQIRTAYLQKVKNYPPDRAPQQFEQIRDAYEVLRDPQRRSKSLIISVDPEAALASLLRDGTNERHFVGADLWLAALNER